MNDEKSEAARLKRNAWARKYRKEHPEQIKATNARYYQKKKASKLAEQSLEKPPVMYSHGGNPESVEMNVYNQVEIYHNCTVQVLTNSITGEVSVGWWRNEEGSEDDA